MNKEHALILGVQFILMSELIDEKHRVRSWFYWLLGVASFVYVLFGD